MDPSDAIVNAILAESGSPSLPHVSNSATVSNAMDSTDIASYRQLIYVLLEPVFKKTVRGEFTEDIASDYRKMTDDLVSYDGSINQEAVWNMIEGPIKLALEVPPTN